MGFTGSLGLHELFRKSISTFFQEFLVNSWPEFQLIHPTEPSPPPLHHRSPVTVSFLPSTKGGSSSSGSSGLPAFCFSRSRPANRNWWFLCFCCWKKKPSWNEQKWSFHPKNDGYWWVYRDSSKWLIIIMDYLPVEFTPYLLSSPLTCWVHSLPGFFFFPVPVHT